MEIFTFHLISVSLGIDDDLLSSLSNISSFHNSSSVQRNFIFHPSSYDAYPPFEGDEKKWNTKKKIYIYVVSSVLMLYFLAVAQLFWCSLTLHMMPQNRIEHFVAEFSRDVNFFFASSQGFYKSRILIMTYTTRWYLSPLF